MFLASQKAKLMVDPIIKYQDSYPNFQIAPYATQQAIRLIFSSILQMSRDFNHQKNDIEHLFKDITLPSIGALQLSVDSLIYQMQQDDIEHFKNANIDLPAARAVVVMTKEYLYRMFSPCEAVLHKHGYFEDIFVDKNVATICDSKYNLPVEIRYMCLSMKKNRCDKPSFEKIEMVRSE